jgi:hypothetical protein
MFILFKFGAWLGLAMFVFGFLIYLKQVMNGTAEGPTPETLRPVAMLGFAMSFFGAVIGVTSLLTGLVLME